MRGNILPVLCAALVLAGCSDGKDGAAAATSTSTTATTASVVASPALELVEWGRDNLADSLDELGTAFTWIGGAVKSRDFADGRAGCRELADHVDALDAKLPAPDAEVTAHLQEVVEQFTLFARLCQRLNPYTTNAELDEMTVYRDKGEAALDRAMAIITAARKAAG